MSDQLAKLQEERVSLAGKVKELSAKKATDWTAEEKGTWETVNKRYDAVLVEMEDLKRVADVSARANSIAELEARANHKPNEKTGRMPGQDDPQARAGEKEVATRADHDAAVTAWIRSQRGMELSEDLKRSAALCRINPRAQELDLRLNMSAPRTAAECRDLSAVVSASGGGLVPSTLVQTIEENMLAWGGMRQVATVMRTSGGGTMFLPTMDDTTNTGELIGESTAVSEADPTFAGVSLGDYKYSSKMVQVPVELLEDSFADVARILGTALGVRIGRKTNLHFTTGDAAAKPKGIITAASSGVTAASQTTVTGDELMNLVHSIDPAYRTSGCGWMFKDATLLILRKLKDGASQYIWAPGLSVSEPDRLLGYPITINQDMATLATGAKGILFGQLSKYIIRDVASFRLRRLVERYAEVDQEAFVAFSRHDGSLLDAGTDPVKYITQA